MAKGLPKSIIKKYGITKKAWQVFRSKHPYKKVYKGGTSKAKTVKSMARKRRYVRKRSYRRKKDKRISLIGTAGAIGSIFIPRGHKDAWSMGKWLVDWATGVREVHPDYMNAFLADTVGQYTGFDWREDQPRWAIPWATVAIIASGFAAKIANKFGGQYLSKTPLIGKYIKF